MRTKYLTLNQKVKLTPIIQERDYNNQEPICILCEQRFIPGHRLWKMEWEHLNNDDTCSEEWNLAWVHAYCNEKKKHDSDFQIIAYEKIKSNKKWHSESLGGGERKSNTDTHTNEQIEANKTETKLAEEYLIERLLPRGENPAPESELDFNDTKESLAYIHYKKHGHGSSNTFDRILRILTSPAAPFVRIKNDGRLKIVRRVGQ